MVLWYYWATSVTETPLNKRAWVYQERTLAPRNLIFGETQIHWECCEVRANESFPLKLPPAIASSGRKVMVPQVDGAQMRKARGLPDDSTLNAFSLWNEIVSGYTKCQLTYSTDKLIALSGIAAEMHKHINGEYLAGMWRKHLAYQLLWDVRGTQWMTHRTRPEVYIAPSWSWASMIGHIGDACVVWFEDDREIALEILEVKIELFNDKFPFGRVKGGFLRVNGILAKAGINIEEDNSGGYRLYFNGTGVGNVILDNNGLEGEPPIQHDLYYLPIRYRNSDVPAAKTVPNYAISGLVLRRSCFSENDEFVRCGRFDLYERCESAFRSELERTTKREITLI